MSARHNQMRVPRQWSPRVVPTFPVEIDPAHPLSSKLAVMVIPGAPSGLKNLGPLGGNFVAANPLAFALQSSGACLSNFTANQVATCAASISTSKGCEFWFGKKISSYGDLITLYIGYTGIASDWASTSGNLTWLGGSGGSYGSTYAIPLGVDTTVAVNFDTTYCNFFGNGVSRGVTGFGTNPTSSNPPSIGAGLSGRQNNAFTYMAASFIVPLDYSEQAWLDAEPFAMVRPIVRRNYFIPSVAGVVAVRRTGNFSMFG